MKIASDGALSAALRRPHAAEPRASQRQCHGGGNASEPRRAWPPSIGPACAAAVLQPRCDLVTAPTCGDLQAPDNSGEFEKFHARYAIANYSQLDILLKLVPLAILAMDATRRATRSARNRAAGGAQRGRPPLAEVFGSIATRPTGSLGNKLACVSRPRLSGRGRLHGSRQLGDVARRRVQVRIRAAHRRAAFQPDGDPAAGVVRAAWHRRRAATSRRPAATHFRAPCHGRSGCWPRSRFARLTWPR